MKEADIVALSGDSLYLNFAASGTSRRVTLLNIAAGMSFRVDDCALVATPQGSLDAACTTPIETFPTEVKALAALDDVHQAIRRHMRQDRALSISRGVAKYVALPLGVLFLVAGVTGTMSGRVTSAPAGVPQMPSRALMNTPAAAAMPLPSMPRAAQDPESLRVTADQVAEALKQGATSGRYTVKLGDVTKGDPVYVFEDPQCPHCREFAPELLKLAKIRPVYVFPVSAIGGEGSSRLNRQTLCAPADKREKTWAMALAGALSDRSPQPATPAQDCSQAEQASQANELIYETIGIKGTPTIFDAKGRKMPYSVEQSVDAINKWLGGES